MAKANFSSLQYFINRYNHDKNLVELGNKLGSTKNADAVIDIYRQSVPAIEHKIWADGIDDETLSAYQALFREMELHIEEHKTAIDNRLKFYIVIPVADRPIHLQQCLNSLLELCHLYQYGNIINQQYQKVSVIVADDSKNKENIEQHKQICMQFSNRGLHTEYFGTDEQIKQLKCLNSSIENLQQILGGYADKPDAANFYHKGAAITRNIAYLRLNQIIQAENEKAIFYFIDSDQEFKIKIATKNGQKEFYAINYLYHLNEIFNREKVSILTGKVVGDPPVSPAVMAGNFQNDIIDFLGQITEYTPESVCSFHQTQQIKGDDAAYHDMADLFGFRNSTQPYHYSCTLTKPHDHLTCFNNFADKLSRFFDGAHPTRITYFDYSGSLSNTIPARTVYTGNYAFKPECLKYFISFATLKLRMAGPVLGRIIKSEIHDQFVSANLPMLHKRTTEETGESEFRPGVNREHKTIDLSDEFERQFFGDIMLFTIETLSQRGFPEKEFNMNIIEQTLHEIETKMHQQYETKHHQIVDRLETLKSLFNDDQNWWNNLSETYRAKQDISRFIDNIEYNFGESSQGYALINDTDNQQKRHHEILQAITSYSQDRKTWESILK